MKSPKHTFWKEILFFGPLRYFVVGGSILLVVWLCMTVPKWVASSKDEVEYNEDLKDHSPAYADIVSIEPVEETFALSDEIPDLYCKCELVGGNTVWVRFTVTQYVNFIDSRYSEPDMAEEILYAKADVFFLLIIVPPLYLLKITAETSTQIQLFQNFSRIGCLLMFCLLLLCILSLLVFNDLCVKGILYGKTITDYQPLCRSEESKKAAGGDH